LTPDQHQPPPSPRATPFPGWVRINPETGKGPPDWKTALFVLLGLFPIVAFGFLYLNPLLSGLAPAIGLFAGYVFRAAATSFLTMPLLVRALDWWLFADQKRGNRSTAIGIAVVFMVFACEIGFVGRLFLWHAR
jgi:antibiotic biosynthesis monooxygenase (ABM) superfamily enzyme